MKPVIMVADDFFPDPDVMQYQVLNGEFENFVSPWDNVTYPGINKVLPFRVVERLHKRLGEILGAEIQPVATFARLTSKNTPAAPHKIHSDRVMANYSAHIYVSSEWPPGGGTSFWTHKTEGHMQTDDTDVDAVVRDMNSLDMWTRSHTCQGKFNRVVIHDARYWHCAEPIGGWGDNPSNGRVVITCFFNVKEKD